MKSRLSKAGTERGAERRTAVSITEGVIWKQLLLFFFPVLIGSFFQQLYNTADAVIVGRFVGKEALACVGGSTAMLVNLVVGFFVGLSSGAGVIIAQFYGAKHEARISEAVHTAMAFALACGVVITATGLLAVEPVLRLMGTPDELMNGSLLYIRIYFAGITTSLIYNMGSGILRAIGDSKRPLYFLMASCLTNIVLDILLVVVGGMGVAGAAIATVCSQVVSSILVLWCLMRAEGACRLIPSKIRLNLYMVRRIVQIGFPAGLQAVMYSLSNITIQSSINALGTDTIAAWTAYSKIDSIFWMTIQAMGISITTFVGQNFGAGKMDRVKRGITVCLGMTALGTLAMSTAIYLGGGYIYLLFTSDAAVIEKGMEILHFLVPTFILYVCIEIYSGALRGVGDCWIPMIMTALGACALRIVWIFVAVPIWPGLLTILFSYPMTWFTTTVLFVIYFFFFSSLRRWTIPLPRRFRKKRKAVARG